MMENELLKRLVTRQLKQDELTPQMMEFLELIDFTLNQMIQERRMVDRATESMLENAENLTIRLTRMNESLDSFNYHISHDLKTGFMNTIGLSKMMLKYLELEDTEKLNEIVHKQIENSNSALKLIDQFLEISKLDSEFTFGIKESIEIQPVLDEIIETIPDLSPTNITIGKKEYSELEYNLNGFCSIFRNLLSNSSKYRSPSRPLEINLDFILVDGNKVVIYRDNGIGIDLEQNKTKLFKPFMRYSNAIGIEGTGIGLYLVRKIIDAEKGEIRLESELDQGIQITIKF